MTKQEEAADYLLHYFREAGVVVDADTRNELEVCVELIIQATLQRIGDRA